MPVIPHSEWLIPLSVSEPLLQVGSLTHSCIQGAYTYATFKFVFSPANLSRVYVMIRLARRTLRVEESLFLPHMPQAQGPPSNLGEIVDRFFFFRIQELVERGGKSASVPHECLAPFQIRGEMQVRRWEILVLQKHLWLDLN